MQILTNPTPTQRALIQTIESLVMSALIAALAAILPFLAGTGAINWQLVGYTFAVTAILSILHGGIAYLRPANQELATALGAVIDLLEKRIPATPVQSNVVYPATIQKPIPGPDTSTHPSAL